MRLRIREICLLSLAAALMLMVKEALAALPNIEGVSLLVILFTLYFSWKTLFPVAVFIAIEGVLYGFGIWWYFYLIAWPLLVVLTILCKPLLGERAWAWAVFNGLFGFLFGAVYAVSLLPIGGWSLAASAYLSGLVFDCLHAGGNFLLAFALFKPLNGLMKRLN